VSTFDSISDLSLVARVRAVDHDAARLYLEFRNGMFATVDGLDPFDISTTGFGIGRRVLVRENDDHVELAPDELWPEEPWVGVVRLKLEDVTVIDSGGSWRLLPTRPHVDYDVGNTVEVRGDTGVVRCLSKKPIRYIDPPELDDDFITKFSPAEGDGQETFDDFGGLRDVIDRARELIEVPLKRKDELAKIRARPIKGVLFTGLPGTGKTMLARIIANSADARFYEISGPQVFSKWYGESEEMLRRIFEHAARQERAIVFFDEIDSVAGQRAEESHEASRRVVAQLLTSMDGFSADDNVVVIAATNRPQDIDAALRRPGRFDWEIRFPLPDRTDREEILRKGAGRLSTRGVLSHEIVADKTEGWSAAELSAIWSEAALIAASGGRSAIRDEDYVGGFERVADKRKRTALPPQGSNGA
jgi:ATP-dependent 26S proteasome regulatory subunit